MENLRFQRIADLDCLVLQRPDPCRAIVLLHGYGADFTDLAGLIPHLDPDARWTWYFPNAPLELRLAGYGDGKAWFPLSLQNLERAARTGDPAPFAAFEPEGLIPASRMVQEFFEALPPAHRTLGIGGFSQGAMVSCDVALHGSRSPSFLWQLSATLVAQARWEEALKTRPLPFPIVQSHGRSDPILPYLAAEELHALFRNYHVKCEFLPFSGGHEIPGQVLLALSNFLAHCSQES